MTRRRFVLANGRRNEKAIEDALTRRLHHYTLFNQHCPGILSAEEWRLDVVVALEADVLLEGLQIDRLQEMN